MSTSFLENDKTIDPANLKQTIYLFVAKDSEMFVYEQHIERQMPTVSFQAEVIEILAEYDQLSEEEKPLKGEKKDLVFDKLKLHVMFDTIYFGLVTLEAFADDKA